VILERNLLAGFLVAMPLVYVARYLFASTGGAANYWLWVEVLGTTIFVALAVLGVRRSPWFLAIGMVLHGLAWDIWHYRNSTYIPDWYAIACLAVDLAFGAYVAARVPAYQRASRIETELAYTALGGTYLPLLNGLRIRCTASLNDGRPTGSYLKDGAVRTCAIP
jgi:hypothetical protein